MKNNRKVNAFVSVKGKIEYSKKIKEAVLDPNITLSNLVLNGGYDWIDTKFGFIKLLLSRGQITGILTFSDLLAREDYFEAIRAGLPKAYSFSLDFCVGKGKGSFASESRIKAALNKWQDFVLSQYQNRGEK